MCAYRGHPWESIYSKRKVRHPLQRGPYKGSWESTWRLKKSTAYGYTYGPSNRTGTLMSNEYERGPQPRILANSAVNTFVENAVSGEPGYVFSGDLGHGPLLMEQIASKIAVPTIGLRRELYLSCGLIKCVEIVASVLELIGGKATIRGLDGNEQLVTLLDENSQQPLAAAHIECYENHVIAAPSEPSTGKMYIRLVVPLAHLGLVENALTTKLKRAKVALVTWWYEKKGGHQEKTLTISTVPHMHDEFYPFIKEGVAAFVEGFLKSEATILYMYGPPGTGKTSLIRWMLWQHSLHAMVTYDERLLSADEMIVDFLDSDVVDCLIVEDADTMLNSRHRADGNKNVGRYLGASDGLVRFPRKKMIFTTNLADLSKVDDALRREGRCYGEVRFRPLTRPEVLKAAAAAGILPPIGDGECSLAKIFNSAKVGGEPPVRIGFAFGGARG